jgi:hypothetical protein
MALLVNRSLVIVANYFNLSLFRESWFLSEQILTAEQINPSLSVFSPNIVQITSDRFQIVIQPNQLIFNLISQEADLLEFEIVSRIVSKLSHTPYQAMGVNFNFMHEDLDGRSGRAMFYQEGENLYVNFADEAERPRYGAYMSKIYSGSRLMLDIKPVISQLGPSDPMNEYLHFQFNYHHDLAGNNLAEHIDSIIKKSKEYFEYSVSIVNQINRNV